MVSNTKRGFIKTSFLLHILKKVAKKEYDNLSIEVKDIKVNGIVQGCSGFIKHAKTGNIIYFTTDTPYKDKYMYRYVKDFKDYKGEVNQWCSSKEDFYNKILNALQKKRA